MRDGFRVGIHGVPLPNVSEITAAHLERVRRAGAETVGAYMDEAERDDPARWAPRLSELLAEAGLTCAYLGAPGAQLLLHDEAGRRAEVAAAARALEAVAALGGGGLIVGPGGFAPEGPWWYHPRNYEPASRAAVVRSLQELGERAGELGVRVLVEGAQTSLLDTPETLRAVLDEAGPDGLGANLDPVNYLTPRQVARFGAAVEEMVEALGPRLAAVHVKDAVVRPELSVHVDEVPAGQGVLDLSPVVEAAARAGVPALVEHLDDADADAAMRTLAALAANLARAA